MNDDVYTSIISVYYISKFFGLTSYVLVNKNGVRKFKTNLSSVVYGCIYTTCHGLCCFFINNFYYDYTGFDSILKHTILLQVNGLVVFVFTFLFIYVDKHSKFVSILNLILECDREIIKLGIFIEYKYIKKFSIKIIIWEFTMYIVMYLFMDFTLRANNLVLVVFQLLDTFLRLSVLLYYEIFILLLQQRYLAINSILRMSVLHPTKKCRFSATNYSIKILLKSAQIYKILFKIVQNVNEIYSVQLLVYLATFFVNEITHIYGACTTLIRAKTFNDFKNCLHSVIWSSYYSVHVFIIIISTSKLAQNVSYILIF